MTSAPTPRTRNVTRAYRAATDQQRASGADWYRRARQLAEELDPTDVPRAAAVVAVLSPRQHWDRNVRYARQAYFYARAATDPRVTIGESLPVLGDQREKVARLLVDREDPDDVVSGPKVRAFWRAIVDPDDPRAVVVDRHAVDVAAGRVLTDRERGVIVGRVGGYAAVADCYSRAARILSREYGEHLTAAQVQATTWEHWRQTHVRTAAANRRRAAELSATVAESSREEN